MPRLSVNLLPPLIALGLTAMLPPVLGLMAPQAKKTAEDKTKIRIVQWASDAKLSRKLSDAEIAKLQKEKTDPDAAVPTYKALVKVAKGQVLQVPDLLETGKKEVAIQGGELAYTKILPGSRLKYVTVNPTSFVRAKPAEMHVQVEKGKAQFRVGTLAQPSTIKVSGPMLATAAKGTAFSVGVGEETTTVLVAEGKVDVFLDSASGDTKTINAGEKFVFRTADGFDFQDQATAPLTPADKREILQLLSLPTQSLYGYERRELSGEDVDNLVILSANQGNRYVDAAGSFDDYLFTYKPSWKPNSLCVTSRDNFWTVDASGKRNNIGKDFYFEGVTLDHKTIFASKPNQGLWEMSWDGKSKKRVTREPISGVISVAPHGKKLYCQIGWVQRDIVQRKSKKKSKAWLPADQKWVVFDRKSGSKQILCERSAFGNIPKNSVIFGRVDYQLGGTRALVTISSYFGKSRIVEIYYNSLISRIVPNRNYLLSPTAKWLVGLQGENKLIYVRTSDFAEFSHQAPPLSGNQRQRWPEFLPGDNEIVLGERVVVIASDGSSSRDRKPEDLSYPWTPKEGNLSSGRWDISPNGKLFVYLPFMFLDGNKVRKYGKIVIGDALKVDRVYTTPFDDNGGRALFWVSDYGILFDGYEEDLNLDIGVKRPTIPQP